MPGIYTTARGGKIDMDGLKLKNETVIAVGNAQTNARGDLVQGGRIIKTRDQLAQEVYNLNGNNIAKNEKARRSSIEPDVVETNLTNTTTNTVTDLQNLQTTDTVEQPNLTDAPRGGLASVVSKSQEIAERLASQRRRI